MHVANRRLYCVPIFGRASTLCTMVYSSVSCFFFFMGKFVLSCDCWCISTSCISHSRGNYSVNCPILLISICSIACVTFVAMFICKLSRKSKKTSEVLKCTFLAKDFMNLQLGTLKCAVFEQWVALVVNFQMLLMLLDQCSPC